MVQFPVLGALKPKQFLTCLGFRSEKREQREPSSTCPLEPWAREGCQSQHRGACCAQTAIPALQLSAPSHPLCLFIWGAGGVERNGKAKPWGTSSLFGRKGDVMLPSQAVLTCLHPGRQRPEETQSGAPVCVWGGGHKPTWGAFAPSRGHLPLAHTALSVKPDDPEPRSPIDLMSMGSMTQLPGNSPRGDMGGGA